MARVKGGARGSAERIEREIRAVLEELRPMLHLGDAALELISFDAVSGVTMLRLEGNCPDCDMPAEALLQGIEAHLRLRVSDVRDVRLASHRAANG